MKLGIISIHYGVNFGSSLQAYVLPTYIERTFPNIETEVINYIPPRYRLKNRYKYSGGKNIIKRIVWCVRIANQIKNNKKYENYLKRHTSISAKIFDEEAARKRYKDFDYLIAGSDQIWNSDYNQGPDSMYYLSFANEKTKKIAYAASCGKDDFPQSEWNEMREYLSSFSNISIREKQMAETMKEKGIECQFVLDPTYLLSKDEWKLIEKKENIKDDYLLIYLLDVDGKDIIEWANRFAKQKNLKTVLIKNGLPYDKYNVDYVMRNKTPDSYIWLFRNASFVVTNSFHGTSFSINMEKQFVVFKRQKYNSRIDSILGAMGLEDRCINLETSDIEEIDYSLVKPRKEKLLDESRNFLERALNDKK